MRNNDIMDEDYGKVTPEPKQPWVFNIFAIVVVACVGSILVALTLRLDKWLLR